MIREVLLSMLVVSVDYRRDIQPIFEKRCVMCHSENATMGSLNLETYAGLQRGGNNGPVVAPGSLQDSLLYRSVVGQAPEIGRMPIGLEPVPEVEVAMLKTWIEEGAQGPGKGPASVSISAGKPVIGGVAAVAPRARQIYTLAYRPDGKVIALAEYQSVVIVDPATQKETARLEGHADAVRALAWSKDGMVLAAAGGAPGRKGEIKIWEADGTLQATASGHADCIYAVAVSPDGMTVASASYDKLIKLWDAVTGKELKTLKDHTDAIYALQFTPDGKRLISGAADRTIKVWDPATGERLYTLSEPTDGVNTLVVSPDGKLLAAAGQDKSIRTWVLGEKTATLQSSLIAHEDAILRIAFSPDGKRLYSSSADRSVKSFRSADLTELGMMPKQSDWAYGLDLSPDGKQLAIGRINGTLTVTGSEFKP
jgi:WD40 repeat protein